jgi:vacuolar iron transporter family protein
VGLGEYLSTATKAKTWDIEYAREKREIVEMPEEEEAEIYDIFDEFKIPREYITPIVEHLRNDSSNWIDVCCFPPATFVHLSKLTDRFSS